VGVFQTGPARLRSEAASLDLLRHRLDLCSHERGILWALAQSLGFFRHRFEGRQALEPLMNRVLLARPDAASKRRGRGIGRDTLFTQEGGEVLAPLPQGRLADVEALAGLELVFGLDHQVNVRMGLVGVQHHRVAILQRKVLARELPSGDEHSLRRRALRHRQHDVVDGLGPRVRPSIVRLRAVLALREVEIPVGHERCAGALAEQFAALVGFDRQLAVPADVVEMRLGAGDIAGSAGDLHHHLGRPSDGASDLLDLLVAEPQDRRRTPSTVTHDVEAELRWRTGNGHDALSLRHRSSPNSSS